MKELFAEQLVPKAEAIRRLEAVIYGLRLGELTLGVGGQTMEMQPRAKLEFQVDAYERGDEQILSLTMKWHTDGVEEKTPETAGRDVRILAGAPVDTIDDLSIGEGASVIDPGEPIFGTTTPDPDDDALVQHRGE